ncbi:MAG: protein translocase subunit SecF [Candidatus Limnocylindrales bacterium]
MLDIIGKRRWYYVISLAVVIPGLIFTLLTLIPNGNLGLRFSIAYTGGTEWTVRFGDGAPEPQAVVAALADIDMPAEVVTTTTGGQVYTLIRTSALALEDGSTQGAGEATGSPAPSASASSASASAAPSPNASALPAAVAGAGPISAAGKLAEAKTALEAAFGPIVEELELTTIGAIVSAELIQQTILLLLMGSVGIMLWITYRFSDFRMGIIALVTLLHDVLVVVGVFAILGSFAGMEVDGLFVTAMLTVIGFSVHDTIVVFDRIRENRVRHAGEPVADIANHSVLQTAGRSIANSMTIMFALLALFLFGGAAIQPFVFALLIGIITGTYSSVFTAAPLFVDWHLRDERRRARRMAAQGTPQARPA